MPEVPTDYRVFTKRFDKVVRAEELHGRWATEAAWKHFLEATLERRTAWEVQSLAFAERVRNRSSERHANTIVSLLVDHSGSMRGERMLLAAAAVDVARAFLVHLGVTVEVLGFTTRSWKGGWSRRLWRLAGRKKNPGRLCDLLHLIYAEAADARPGTGLRSLSHMLDPLLLKENVDGEALIWAADRQDEGRFARKVIVMISDGAPVDDSTLLANGPTFLNDHLWATVDQLSQSRTLAQLQIGEDRPESPFSFLRKANTLSDVGTELLALLEEMLTEEKPTAS